VATIDSPVESPPYFRPSELAKQELGISRGLVPWDAYGRLHVGIDYGAKAVHFVALVKCLDFDLVCDYGRLPANPPCGILETMATLIRRLELGYRVLTGARMRALPERVFMDYAGFQTDQVDTALSLTGADAAIYYRVKQFGGSGPRLLLRNDAGIPKIFAASDDWFRDLHRVYGDEQRLRLFDPVDKDHQEFAAHLSAEALIDGKRKRLHRENHYLDALLLAFMSAHGEIET
jgi:hypothetical protein